MQPARIGDQDDALLRIQNDLLALALHDFRQQAHARLAYQVQVTRFELQFEMAGFNAGKIEQVVDQVQEMAAALQDNVDCTLLALVDIAVDAGIQRLAQSEHGSQGSPQLVTHGCQELVFVVSQLLQAQICLHQVLGAFCHTLLERRKHGDAIQRAGRHVAKRGQEAHVALAQHLGAANRQHAHGRIAAQQGDAGSRNSMLHEFGAHDEGPAANIVADIGLARRQHETRNSLVDRLDVAQSPAAHSPQPRSTHSMPASRSARGNCCRVRIKGLAHRRQYDLFRLASW